LKVTRARHSNFPVALRGPPRGLLRRPDLAVAAMRATSRNGLPTCAERGHSGVELGLQMPAPIGANAPAPIPVAPAAPAAAPVVAPVTPPVTPAPVGDAFNTAPKNAGVAQTEAAAAVKPAEVALDDPKTPPSLSGKLSMDNGQLTLDSPAGKFQL